MPEKTEKKVAARRITITVLEITCDICGHRFFPRDLQTMPKRCAKCKSPRFNSGGRKYKVRSDKGVPRKKAKNGLGTV